METKICICVLVCTIVAICFLIVICIVTRTMVLEINRKLNLVKMYLEYNSKLLEKIELMLEKKGF